MTEEQWDKFMAEGEALVSKLKYPERWVKTSPDTYQYSVQLPDGNP